jgi:hypothetical protein
VALWSGGCGGQSGGLWTRLGAALGKANALAMALVIQAVSVFILATSPAFVLALLAALLFGSTFMGVTAVMFAIGADIDLGRSSSWLTVVYGVGQVLGPLLVGRRCWSAGINRHGEGDERALHRRASDLR